MLRTSCENRLHSFILRMGYGKTVHSDNNHVCSVRLCYRVPFITHAIETSHPTLGTLITWLYLCATHAKHLPNDWRP